LSSLALESESDTAVAEVSTKADDLHHFLALVIVEHNLTHQLHFVRQMEGPHKHAGFVRHKSEHSRMNFVLALVRASRVVVDCRSYFKRRAFNIVHSPFSAKLELVAKGLHNVDFNSAYGLMLLKHSTIGHELFEGVRPQRIFLIHHHLHHFMLIHHTSTLFKDMSKGFSILLCVGVDMTLIALCCGWSSKEWDKG
jgi:hypothetical protein